MDRLSARVDAFIGSLPASARPPFIGMLAVYTFIAMKAIYLFPITICVLVLGGPEGILTAVWILILAGIAGFAGGLAFTLIDPLAHRIGRMGPYALWSCSFGAYITTAVLLVDGHREGGPPHLAHLQAFNWWILAIGSVVFGSVIAHALTSQKIHQAQAMDSAGTEGDKSSSSAGSLTYAEPVGRSIDCSLRSLLFDSLAA